MAYSLSFLLSADAAKQRMASRKPRFVAHMELPSGEFQELDADSVEHAHTLCANWCQHGCAVSAAARRVMEGGNLSKVVGRIHSDADSYQGAL